MYGCFAFFFVNQIGRTEMILNNLNPKFAKKFVLDYYFEMVQKMKFSVYDIDNDTPDLSDDDFLGELECTLGQVSFSLYSSESELFVLLPIHCSVTMSLSVSRLSLIGR